MGKSYRRHHKRPKRKNTRRRRTGGADGDSSSPTSSSWSSMLSPSMRDTLNKHYRKGVQLGEKHMNNANIAYKDFKNKNPTNFAMAKSGESAYSRASKSMGSSMASMKSSMGSMGSSMGFSSLRTNTPNVKELQHAQQASSMGVPSAFSQESQTSAL